MPTTKKLTIERVEQETGLDLRCRHCRGSGLPVNYSDEWLPALLELHRLGKIRKQNRHPIGDAGRIDLRQAWLDIINVWENWAQPLYIPAETAAKAAGLEKGSFYYGLKEYKDREAS